MSAHEVREGDCLDLLRDVPDCSVDSIVTDPPYGLSREPDLVEVLGHWLAGEDYEHRGGGFMGESWDGFVPGPSVWRECLRVLKPGGHLLAFSGARTVDLMGVALRLGGFERRDTIAWMYGQGFPKSLDVGKAIDKAAGAAREVVGQGRSTCPGIAAGGPCRCAELYGPERAQSGGTVHAPQTAPATPEAAEWEGWGTALKPAHEPVAVCRKPIEGTVAANVLAHGTGAVNVAGAALAFLDEADEAESKAKNRHADFGTEAGGNEVYGDYSMVERKNYDAPGRWPPNVALDPSAAAELDAQSGERAAGNVPARRQGIGFTESQGRSNSGTGGDRVPLDGGGASRFMFCSKAGRTERDAGLDGFNREPILWSSGEQSPGTFQSEGTDRTAKNAHQTVKPIDLMAWLVRLATPPGGLVLDPFSGSGSTGCAAALQGFRYLGLELDARHCRVARARIAWAAEQHAAGRSLEQALGIERAAVARKAADEAAGQGGLF